jgi:hypothetical protein
MEELIFGSLIVWALGRIAKKKADQPPGTIAPAPGNAQARALHSKCLAQVVQITPLPLVDLVDLHTILIILVVVQVVAAQVNYNFFVILFSLSLTALIKKSNYGLS